VDSRGLDETMEILGEVVLRPLFTKEELNTCQMIIRSPHQSVSSLYHCTALYPFLISAHINLTYFSFKSSGAFGPSGSGSVIICSDLDGYFHQQAKKLRTTFISTR
jgi:hypothetical protein